MNHSPFFPIRRGPSGDEPDDMTGSFFETGSVEGLFPRIKREWSALIGLGLPILGGQLAQQSMSFVDTMMAGRVSAVDLAGVSVGSSLWSPVLITVIGILMSLPPAVSRYFGAKDPQKIASTIHQGFWLALLLSFPGWLVLQNASIVLHWMDVPPGVRDVGERYLKSISWGIPPLAFYQVLRFYSEGIGLTAPVMLVSFVGLAVNIPANYFFIYGYGWIPAMGGAGCGAATAIVIWVMVFVLFLYILLAKSYREYPIFPLRSAPDRKALANLVKVGGPIGASLFMELGVFSFISVLIATLGPRAAASNQIAINFVSLLFMVPLSVSMAVTIRIGHSLGRWEGRLARFSGRSAILLNGLIALVFSAVILLVRNWIPYIYTTEVDVATVASGLLLFAVVFEFADSVQIASAGALRGYSDTRFPMLVVVFSYWIISLPLGYTIGLTDGIMAPLGVQGFWIAIVLGLSLAAISLYFRFERTSAKEIARMELSTPNAGESIGQTRS